jgi:hypothetical protein
MHKRTALSLLLLFAVACDDGEPTELDDELDDELRAGSLAETCEEPHMKRETIIIYLLDPPLPPEEDFIDVCYDCTIHDECTDALCGDVCEPGCVAECGACLKAANCPPCIEIECEPL